MFMQISRKLFRPAACLILLATAACSHVDNYPMHNAVTGTQVVCHSGVYWINKDKDEQRVAEQCIASCARHGFNLMPEGTNGSRDLLNLTPDDMRSNTPLECLP
jgi:hypothetical protein